VLIPGAAELGQTLANNGIYFQLGYIWNFNSLVTGGSKTGVVPNGELFFGSVLDLQKIMGLTGASIHITFDERSGYGLGSNVGTDEAIGGNVGPTRQIRLSEFYWEQAIDHDRIDIQVGRTNPTLNFATSDISCQFVGGVICAQPDTWYASNSNQAYPASTWGGFVNFLVTPDVYFRTGAYQDDPEQATTSEQGFSWFHGGSTGAFVPFELGYQTTFDNARYPEKYDVGGYWDDATYTSVSGVPMRGRSAVWVQGQQAIWRPDPKTQQSLTLFGGGIFYNREAPVWSQIYAGVFDRGPFASRPDDTIGLVGSYYANNSDQRPNGPSQWIFEVNYGLQIVKGVIFKPYTQYIVAPNNLLAPPGTREPSNAWVLGFQLDIDLASFLGFPKFVPY
jgi:porin